jgi:hypothetical protein
MREEYGTVPYERERYLFGTKFLIRRKRSTNSYIF